MSLAEGGFFLLSVAKADVFGPPKRASAPQVTAQMGAAILSHGMGRAAYVSWQPARLYLTSGSRDYQAMIMDLLAHLIDEPHPVRTDAPSALERFFHRLSPQRYLLRLLNPSGFNGTTYEPPTRLTAFTITLNLSGRVESVTNLTSDCPARTTAVRTTPVYAWNTLHPGHHWKGVLRGPSEALHWIQSLGLGRKTSAGFGCLVPQQVFVSDNV